MKPSYLFRLRGADSLSVHRRRLSKVTKPDSHCPYLLMALVSTDHTHTNPSPRLALFSHLTSPFCLSQPTRSRWQLCSHCPGAFLFLNWFFLFLDIQLTAHPPSDDGIFLLALTLATWKYWLTANNLQINQPFISYQCNNKDSFEKRRQTMISHILPK